MSYEEDKLIDEFSGWECPSTPHHQFIINHHNDLANVKTHKDESSDATVRQSTPIQQQSRPTKEDGTLKESLFNALQAVAVALAAAEDSQDPTSSALRVLHQFCDAGSEISQESSRRERPSLGTESDCMAGTDIDTDTAELLELMRMSGMNETTHYTRNSQNTNDHTNSPLIPHPWKSTLDNLEVRRYTLDPNWRLGEIAKSSSTATASGTSCTRRIHGNSLLHSETLHEVDLPMLPPQLGQASTTPLNEKDAFNKSTPPLPVRGDSARQLYLKTRPSTQKLAERLNRIHPSEQQKSKLSPAFGHSAASPVGKDENSPVEHNSSNPYIDISVHEHRSNSNPRSSGRLSNGLRCAAVKSKSVFNYNPISKRLVAQGTEMSSSIDQNSECDKGVVSKQVAQTVANTQTTESLLRSGDAKGPVIEKNKQKGDQSNLETTSEISSAGFQRECDALETKETVSEITALPTGVERIQSSAVQSIVESEPLNKNSKTRGRDASKRKSDSRSRRVSRKGSKKENKRSNEDNAERIPHQDETIQLVSPWQTPRPTLGVSSDETNLVVVAIDQEELTNTSNQDCQAVDNLAICSVAEPELLPIQEVKKNLGPPERQSFGIQVTTEKIRRKVNRQKGGSNTASEKSKVPSKGKLRRISICDVENPDIDPSATQALEGGKIVRQRSKRIRIAPLAWWAGEHIEYQSFDGSIVNATATAVYKVENQSQDRINVKNKKGTSESKTVQKNSPQDSTNRSGIADRSIKQGVKPSLLPDNDSRIKIDTSGCFNSSKGAGWMKDIELHKTRVMQAVANRGQNERVVAVRLKEGEWLPVAQNGYNYSVRLLLQTLRNTTVGFQLEPKSSKVSEDKAVMVETSKVNQSERKQTVISIGEWIVIPPQSYYTVTNRSRIKSCTILAHVVACDNELFKAFLGPRQS